MAFTHADYRFNVTIYTDDRAVVNCLRALGQDQSVARERPHTLGRDKGRGLGTRRS